MIVKAVNRAYLTMAERKWDTIYWAIDLHGVCLQSNYKNNSHEFINPEVIRGLQAISKRPESVIIIWSGMHKDEQLEVKELFAQHNIDVKYFNENPREGSTKTGNFAEKFYFSVLLDDKAGFDPAIHWTEIIDYLEFIDKLNSLKQSE